MKLSLIQLAIEHANPTTNVDNAVQAIIDAAAGGADLVALPEIFNVGYFAFDVYQRHAEPLSGPTLSRIGDAAATNDVGVLAGSIVEDLEATSTIDNVPTPAEEGLANTSVLFDRSGERISVYRKHHLFGYGSAETELLTPGERVEVAEFGPFTIGMTTCYDLRFPELYRTIAEAGATLILVPSAWPYPRVEHWQILSRARAIENQLYVATINGSGKFPDATLVGRSTVFDPWGVPLASSDDEPTVISTSIDPDRVEHIRTEFPAWHDRRM